MRYSVERKFRPKEPQLATFDCRECGAVFEDYHTYNRLVICSEACRTIRYGRMRREIGERYRAKHYKPPKPRDCQYCIKPFTPGGTRSDARFCSLKCGNRGRSIERLYKINISEYHQLVAQQNGLCAGCSLPFGDTTPYVDHNHDTGDVRGLLHANCNTILGFVKDNSTALRQLAKYLEKA